MLIGLFLIAIGLFTHFAAFQWSDRVPEFIRPEAAFFTALIGSVVMGTIGLASVIQAMGVGI